MGLEISRVTLLRLIEAVDVVKAVQAVEAVKRIPDRYKNLTFFSDKDIWMFELHRTPGTCEACEELEGSSWPGGQLRVPFPYLTILDEDTIGGPDNGDGLVHPNCRCRLKRLTTVYDLVFTEVPATNRPKTVRDNYNRGYFRTVKHLEQTKIETNYGRTVEILIVNKPSTKTKLEFTSALDKVPKDQLDGVTKVKLINGIGRRGKDRVAGYYNPLDKEIVVYSKGGTIEKTLHHEVAHYIYKANYNKWLRDSWESFWRQHREDMPSDYARWEPEEGFTECFGWSKADKSRVQPYIRTWLFHNQLLSREDALG